MSALPDQPAPRELRMIPVDLIDVLNHRERNARVFEEIVANIKTIGIKKPISVTPRPQKDGTERYLLICGEGRLNAFVSLGEAHIPALVVDVSDEDALIMSLTENIARRQYRPLEFLAGIKLLHDKGYSDKVIAKKTGLVLKYVQGMLTLVQHGEQRLLLAVERGQIPLNTALTIVGAGDDDSAVQVALQEAYESGTLRGQQLTEARKVIDRRKTLGRTVAHSMPRTKPAVTTSSVIRSYQEEYKRQKQLVKRADLAQQRVQFVTTALRKLLADENFVNLLRAEGLDTLPKQLSDQVWPTGRGS